MWGYSQMFFEGFNGSIWHALWVLFPAGLAVYLVALLSVKRGHHYLFDPKHNKDRRLRDAGEFGPHSQRYQDLAKLAIALSTGAIAFLVNTLASQKPPLPDFAQRIASVAPIVVGFFGMTITFLILFMTLQTLWYEEYCHSPTHNTYKAWKYALCNSLGWSGLLSFLLGFGWLARNLFV
jgi:hypothetical protein